MLNFIKLCRDKRIPFIEEGHHHCHAGWCQVHCPFCSSGKEGWHLGYSLEKGTLNCWRCGTHSVWDFLSLVLNQNKAQVYEILREYQAKGQGRKRQKEIIRKKICVPPPGMEGLAQSHKRYLRKRKFTPSHLQKEWGLSGTTYLSGVWSWRIIIPISDKEGNIVAYQGRAINETAKPKYKMTDDKDILVNPKSLLYGINKVPKDSIVVVEGATGVWRLGPGAVGTLGIGWHPEQAAILRMFKNRFILFDPEPVAQKRAEELASWLSYYPGSTEILSGFRTDPGDFSDIQARRIMKKLGVTNG